MRTDGTPEGTYEINFDGIAYEVQASGDKVYMSGWSERYGHELFFINESQGTRREHNVVKRVTENNSHELPGNDALLYGFPNPFKSQFSLRVNGQENAQYKVSVVSADGVVIDRMALNYNETHEVGQSWKAGMYILQIYASDKLHIRKIIKTY